MTSATQSDTVSTTAPNQEERGPLPWVILAFWFAWLAALVFMSIPEWGKSKRDLIESNARPDVREVAPQQQELKK